MALPELKQLRQLSIFLIKTHLLKYMKKKGKLHVQSTSMGVPAQSHAK